MPVNSRREVNPSGAYTLHLLPEFFRRGRYGKLGQSEAGDYPRVVRFFEGRRNSYFLDFYVFGGANKTRSIMEETSCVDDFLVLPESKGLYIVKVTRFLLLMPILLSSNQLN